jgi:hypothetical protein
LSRGYLHAAALDEARGALAVLGCDVPSNAVGYAQAKAALARLLCASATLAPDDAKRTLTDADISFVLRSAPPDCLAKDTFLPSDWAAQCASATPTICGDFTHCANGKPTP